ncbi:GIY-YIG nuclease family protein [Halobacillus yeomjeoni]|uniref:GIY-YIG nuclease family protein n=1 Tax=Halobacillus yeomjeoni TaxID=311194 RepID=UPI001CD30D8C|nr:GIY-YIG nuclease family protein [Halobacillus yeomjeoni]MCA0984307.1 GIY-YIG nuclease family protein [Halobacillus yeomjeoni]
MKKRGEIMGTKKDELLSKGIYAIINKTHNLIYVGETQRNFLCRWVDHLFSIPNYAEDKERMRLYLHKDTKFIVLKTLDDSNYKTEDFYSNEYQAYEFYKKKNWGIVSKNFYRQNTNYKDRTLGIDKQLDHYKKRIKGMVHFLSTVNTKHTNGSIILSNLYTHLNREFNTDVRERGEGSVLQHLTQEELEFILLDLYPRFHAKKIACLRQELTNNQPKQMELF